MFFYENLGLLLFFSGIVILVIYVFIHSQSEVPEDWSSEWIYDSFTPREFELLLTELWDDKGYSATVSKNGADGGIDVSATKRGVSVAIEAKLYNPESNKVGRPIIQKAVGASKQYGYSKTVVVTTSSFSDPAIKSEDQLKSKRQSIELYNGEKLASELNDSTIDPLEGKEKVVQQK